MQFFVNADCIGCGLCVSICPEVFRMTPEGVSAAVADSVSGSMVDSAMQALRDCPVSAIEQK